MHYLCRFPQVPSTALNPMPILNYSVSLDDDGKPVFTPKEPVALSLAAEFSVSEMALVNSPKVSPRRSSKDIVDVDKML